MGAKSLKQPLCCFSGSFGAVLHLETSATARGGNLRQLQMWLPICSLCRVKMYLFKVPFL